MPSLNPDGSCPETRIGFRNDGASYQGSDWAFVANLRDVALHDLPRQGDWYGQKVLFAISVGEPGPVLVRVRPYDEGNAVGLGDGNAAQLVLSGAANGGSTDTVRIYIDGVNLQDPGCYVMQLDGSTSATIVFQALP